MYIKVLGAAAAIGACLMGGHSFYMSKKQEYLDLVSFRLMLQLIRSELHSCPAELSTILDNIQGRLQWAASNFVHSLANSMDRLGETTFCQLWEECIAAHLSELHEEEQKLLLDMGGVIGRYDAAQQIISLDAAIEKFLFWENERAKGLESDKKLSVGLPGALGLMLVIVLI